MYQQEICIQGNSPEQLSADICLEDKISYPMFKGMSEKMQRLYNIRMVFKRIFIIS